MVIVLIGLPSLWRFEQPGRLSYRHGPHVSDSVIPAVRYASNGYYGMQSASLLFACNCRKKKMNDDEDDGDDDSHCVADERAFAGTARHVLRFINLVLEHPHAVGSDAALRHVMHHVMSSQELCPACKVDTQHKAFKLLRSSREKLWSSSSSRSSRVALVDEASSYSLRHALEALSSSPSSSRRRPHDDITLINLPAPIRRLDGAVARQQLLNDEQEAVHMVSGLLQVNGSVSIVQLEVRRYPHE